MCAISQALVYDCVSDVFIPFLCVRPSSRHRNYIKVTDKPRYPIHIAFLMKAEKSIILFWGVCVWVSFCVDKCAHDRVQGVLIQLAFKALINCHGICLFGCVNAISHAECLVNGCLPIAGPASALSFFPLPLAIVPPLSSLLCSSALSSFSSSAL